MMPSADHTALLDPARLGRADTVVRQQPFAFLIASGQLADHDRADLVADFPRYDSAGFFPYQAPDCGPRVQQLVQELAAPAFADALGSRLGIPELASYPSLVTICRSLNRRHGTIHTDSRSKIATALLYLNEDWPSISEGCLRFLARIDSIDDVLAPEVRPVYGNLVAFKRADNSFHGHLPSARERHVIQIAWLTSEDEKTRKTRRGRFSRLFKKLFGSVDRRIGAGRADNASHRD